MSDEQPAIHWTEARKSRVLMLDWLGHAPVTCILGMTWRMRDLVREPQRPRLALKSAQANGAPMAYGFSSGQESGRPMRDACSISTDWPAEHAAAAYTAQADRIHTHALALDSHLDLPPPTRRALELWRKLARPNRNSLICRNGQRSDFPTRAGTEKGGTEAPDPHNGGVHQSPPPQRAAIFERLSSPLLLLATFHAFYRHFHAKRGCAAVAHTARKTPLRPRCLLSSQRPPNSHERPFRAPDFPTTTPSTNVANQAIQQSRNDEHPTAEENHRAGNVFNPLARQIVSAKDASPRLLLRSGDSRATRGPILNHRARSSAVSH